MVLKCAAFFCLQCIVREIHHDPQLPLALRDLLEVLLGRAYYESTMWGIQCSDLSIEVDEMFDKFWTQSTHILMALHCIQILREVRDSISTSMLSYTYQSATFQF